MRYISCPCAVFPKLDRCSLDAPVPRRYLEYSTLRPPSLLVGAQTCARSRHCPEFGWRLPLAVQVPTAFRMRVLVMWGVGLSETKAEESPNLFCTSWRQSCTGPRVPLAHCPGPPPPPTQVKLEFNLAPPCRTSPGPSQNTVTTHPHPPQIRTDWKITFVADTGAFLLCA